MAVTLAVLGAVWALAGWILLEQRQADAAFLCMLAAAGLLSGALYLGLD